MSDAPAFAGSGATPAGPACLRVGYLSGQYPRATDTFVQREVAGLRQRGVFVQTFSVRRPAAAENVGTEQQAERAGTIYLLPPSILALLGAHLKLLSRGPRRYMSALKTALTVRPPGLKALGRQAAYFAEAGLLAGRARALGLSHVHNHFADASCMVAMLAAELGGFTFSFTAHGPAEFFEPTYWSFAEKVRRALFVVCISHFCRSQVMALSPTACWGKLQLVHCGVNPSDYAPPAGRHRGAGTRLLFVGRLAAVKGLPVLLEALALLRRDRPDVKLVVAGDGPDREALREQAGRLGVAENVEFLGYQSQAQVRGLLAAADVFVMASFAEGVPVVLMEAMAAGVPVVATRIAGVPELVEDGVSGFLVPPAEPQNLAAAVERLLQDGAMRQFFGENGRRKVQREFDVAAEADKLCRVLSDAVAGPAAGEEQVKGAGVKPVSRVLGTA